jgi:hypothetical protein
LETTLELLLRTLVISLIIIFTANLQAALDKPLVMEGKKTLYQRVLSTPDAQIYQSPDNSVESSAMTPFSVLYVYEKSDDWIKVGHDSFGKTVGWMQRDETIIWNQALTVSFKDPQDIQRVMLFNSKQSIKQLVDDYDTEAYQDLYQSVVNDEAKKDSPVIAIQPEAHVDIRENFYLVPIIQHEDVYLDNEQARLLEVPA